MDEKYRKYEVRLTIFLNTEKYTDPDMWPWNDIVNGGSLFEEGLTVRSVSSLEKPIKVVDTADIIGGARV